jgi:hypothetical protein
MDSSQQRLAKLAQRRAELVARSAVQRAELGNIVHSWRVPMAIADQGVATWRFLRGHPALLVGLGVAFVVARPRKAVKWLRRGWTLWRFFSGMAVRLGKLT